MLRCRRLVVAALASLPLCLLPAGLPAGPFGAAPAAAQGDAAVPRVMIVDSQRILREADAVRQLQGELEGERDAFRDQLREREAELREDDAELTRERQSLNNEDYLQRRRALEERFAGYQREIAERRRALEGRFTKGMREVESRLIEIVGAVAKARGATLVLPKSAVLLSDPDYDATEEVLTRLNETLPRVEVPEE